MKAGWLFTPCVRVGGALQPYFPPGVSPGFSSANPVEIHRLAGAHVHFLSGAFALPNMALGDNHWHAVLRVGDAYQQLTVGAEAHTHDDAEQPACFLPFVVCSDADAQALAADPQCHLAALCPIAEDGTLGPEDDTPWTAAERDAWAARFLAALGLHLPSAVDRPRRLVLFILGLNNRRYSDAQPLRPGRT